MVRLRTQKNRTPLPWMRTHKLISLFMFIVLLVAGIFVYERIALELNKRAFAHARSAIDTVYADIIKSVGPPDNSKRSSDCSIYENEFVVGPDYCNIDTSFIYGVLDEDEATAQFKKIQTVINQHKNFKPTRPLSLKITDQTVVNSAYHTASDEFIAAGLPCIVNYVYDTPREIFLSINDSSKKPFQIVIGCNGKTWALYYPRTD
jgi:hypothetical protein